MMPPPAWPIENSDSAAEARSSKATAPGLIDGRPDALHLAEEFCVSLKSPASVNPRVIEQPSTHPSFEACVP
jgi:hypothetical protein